MQNPYVNPRYQRLFKTPGAYTDAARRARVRNFLNSWTWTRDWGFPAFREWSSGPGKGAFWAQDLVQQDHKDNRERYRLFLFLVINGLRPDLAKDITWMYDVAHGKYPLIAEYDRAAQSQMDIMIADTYSGKIYEQPRSKVYSIHHGYPI